MEKAPDAFRTISEVAEELDLPQHVLRFWETRFSQIKPMKRGGGRRYYRPDDVDLLRGIRHLLYGEGYTIRGVQRILKDHGIKFVQTVWQVGAPQPARSAGDVEEADAIGEHGHGEGDRGRGLFGILPAFLGSGEAAAAPARLEPPIEDITARQPPVASENGHERPAHGPGWRGEKSEGGPDGPAAMGRMGNVSRDHVAQLQATLSELIECKRLLDDILTGKP